MSQLTGLVSWWLASLGELLPSVLREADPAMADALIAEPDGSGFRVLLRRRGRETSFAAAGTALAPALSAAPRGSVPAETLLRVSGGTLLEREVTLPLAAASGLDRVLAYEMDRLTPFAADQVHWAHGPARLDQERGRLTATLYLVPRAAVAGVVATLSAAGRPPAALLATGADGGVRRIELAKSSGASPARLPAMAAWACCAILAVVAAALPIIMQYRALSAVEATIASTRPALAEADTLRQRIAGSSGGPAVFAAEEARLGSALRTIAALTDLLPDDTYLTALTLRARQVTITGQSADAARLIPRLSADPTLREAAFLSPVTRAEPSRAEIFAIRLELVP